MPPRLWERALYGYGVGCNRLGCRDCGGMVLLDGDTWRCGCSARQNTETLAMAHQPHGIYALPMLPWSCQGHPEPTATDLAAEGFTDDLLADLHRLLHTSEQPKHHPSGHRGYHLEVRLDADESFDVDAVCEVLIRGLDGQDDVATHRAMKVLFHRKWAPLDGAVFRWSGLKERQVPGYGTLTLGAVWVQGIAQLARAGGPDSQAYEEARRLRSAGAGGKNSLLWSVVPRV